MIKLRKNYVVDFLLFCTVLFNCGHAFQTLYPSVSRMIFFPVLLFFLMIPWGERRLKMTSSLLMMLTVMVMVFCTWIVDMGTGAYFYITFLITVIAAYYLTSTYSFSKVASLYIKLMTVVSVVALVGYILVQTTTILDALPRVENINGIKYAVGGIFNYIAHIPDRNCGMFWEPGLFATHLTIATVFELTLKEKANIWRLLLFSVCVFTANSSAGFVLWFLCVVLYFVRTQNNAKKNNIFVAIFKFFFVVAISVLALYFVLQFDAILANTSLGENEYFQKLSTENINESSRSNAITHNIKQFWSSPLFGSGYDTVVKNIAHVADTSTSTFLMSIFGILGASYTIFIVYGVLKIKRQNVLSRLLILAIALIIVNKEPHYQNIFTWMLIFYLVKGIEMSHSEKTEVENNPKNQCVDRGVYEYKKLFKR